ncbi:MAG: YitT family protein [Aminobacterium colombiense]|nr:YitT family protein [Aminobacterium colombiense]
MKQFLQREWLTIIYTTIGTIIISFALVALIMPYRFASAGLTGIALISHYALNISPAWIIAIGNTVLLLWGWKVLSPRFVIWTFYVSILMTVSVMFFELFTYPLIQNVFLAAILGGVLGGLGMGLIFLGGGSSGGTDIIVMAARKKYGIDVGMYSFYINMGILLASWFVVDLEQLLMGGVLLYIESLTIDNVLKSFDRRKQLMIITQKPGEVKRFIIEELDRSATIIDARGAYSGEPKNMIMVVLTRRQAMELKRHVVSIDPMTFIILSDVAEVVGDGFKHWKNI